MDVGGAIELRYRPVVDREEVDHLVDVQELLLVLERDDAPTILAEVGRKRLPEDPGTPNWGHVRQVVSSRDELEDALSDEVYETRTRGVRHQSAARLAAAGTWRLERDGRDTVLSVDVSVEIDADLAGELGIREDSAYVITVKNPRATREDGPGLRPERAPDYPDDLQARFDGNRWTAVDPVDLLEHEGAEFVLIPVEAP